MVSRWAVRLVNVRTNEGHLTCRALSVAARRTSGLLGWSVVRAVCASLPWLLRGRGGCVATVRVRLRFECFGYELDGT